MRSSSNPPATTIDPSDESATQRTYEGKVQGRFREGSGKGIHPTRVRRNEPGRHAASSAGKVQGRYREGSGKGTRPSRGIFRSVAPVATSNTVT